jgi:histidinol dehydrogenase
VPASALARALDRLDPDVRAALTESVRRVRLVHEAQRPAETRVQVVPGGAVTRRQLPVDRVGLYVPGGLAPLPSSVVMNVVPAQVAGVRSLALASPPRRDSGGLPDRTILAACALLGVDEVYAVGGAQAVAMLAYGLGGSEPVVPVDLVTGPGNVYVTAAKRLLRGVVGIDSEAGPSEVAVLADSGADPVLVAADLLSQAEHGPSSASVLVTDSVPLADAVDAELAAQVAATKHVERVTEALTGPQSGTVLVRDVEQGRAVADAYGAEHLEIHTRDAAAVARRVRNAGCVFVGPHSPVSLGDYAAGSNHVLPTGGSCRHSAGLSVQTFLRGISLVEYDEDALAGVAGHVLALAHAEDLPAHGAAITLRLPRPGRTQR